MQGAAIAVSISNYSACVELTVRDGDSSIELEPNNEHDPATFARLEDLHEFSSRYGYYGGRRLLMVRAVKHDKPRAPPAFLCTASRKRRLFYVQCNTNCKR
jgi:hypothetical protein